MYEVWPPGDEGASDGELLEVRTERGQSPEVNCPMSTGVTRERVEEVQNCCTS